MRTFARYLLLTGLMSIVFCSWTAWGDGTSENMPAGLTMEVAGEPVVGTADGGDVLLVQDVLPWYTNANTAALTAAGLDFDVVTSSALSGVTLSDYRILMYASAQGAAYWSNLVANRPAIDAFVGAGGFLLADACDLYGQEWTTSILPGGVTHIHSDRDDIQIQMPSHELITGDGTQPPLTAAYLSGWGYSTHGYFTNLVAGTDVVLSSGGTLPVCIDYKFGAGRVLATMQTAEWGYSVRDRPQFLANLIAVASAWSPFTELEMVEAKLDVVEGKLDAIELRLDDLPDPTGAIQELKSMVRDLAVVAARERAALEAKLDGVQVDLLRIKAALAAATTERQALEAKLDTAETGLDAVEAKLDNMSQRTLAPGQQR